MLYEIKGTVEVSPYDQSDLPFYRDQRFQQKQFSIEVIAECESELSEERVLGKLQFESQWECRFESFRNCTIGSILHISFAGLGDLGNCVFNNLAKIWLKQNYHLLLHGFSADILYRPESIPASQAGGGLSILLLDPETGELIQDLQTSFPKTLTPYIVRAVKTELEAEIAIDLVFQRLKVKALKESDGNHHSSHYGQDRYWYFEIDMKNSFALATNTGELTRQIKSYAKSEPNRYLNIRDLYDILLQVKQEINEELKQAIVLKVIPMGSFIYLQDQGQVKESLIHDVDIVLIVNTDELEFIKQLAHNKLGAFLNKEVQVIVYSSENTYLDYMKKKNVLITYHVSYHMA